MGKAVYTVDEVALAKLLAAMSGQTIALDFNGTVADVKAPAPAFDNAATLK